jgi:protein subunit release factor A
MIPELNEIDLNYETVYPNRAGSLVDKNPIASIIHIPTGLHSECDYTRSWRDNKNIAIGMLTQQVFDYLQHGREDRL